MADAFGAVEALDLASISESNERLSQADYAEFPQEWVVRTLTAEFARYTIEDDYIDTKSADYSQARKALSELKKGGDWLDPKLRACLVALQKVAGAPSLRHVTREKVIDGNPKFSIVEREAKKGYPFTVSNAYANTVAIIEQTLSDPRHCAGLVNAFADRIEILKRDCGVNHLMFVEKEAGPVGAITMMSSLVRASGLPACVYRETHWLDRASLVGTAPSPSSRLAIIYDLIVTGAAVRHAADRVLDTTGGQTAGVVVLCGYQQRRDKLITEKGQTIRIEALDWNERTVASDQASPTSGDVGDELNSSALREASPEVPMKTSVTKPIPPGVYTRETLPPLSPGARAIIERVQARARQRQEKGGTDPALAGVPEDAAGALRLRPVDTAIESFRLADKALPSILGERKK